MLLKYAGLQSSHSFLDILASFGGNIDELKGQYLGISSHYSRLQTLRARDSDTPGQSELIDWTRVSL